MKLFLTFVLFIFPLYPCLFAQQNRIEIPARLYFENHFAVPIGKDGFIIFSENETNKDKFYFKRYDTGFNELWNVETEIKTGLNYMGHTCNKKSLYVLFGKTSIHDYQIIKVNTILGFIEKAEVYSLNNVEINFFEAHEEFAYIGGKIRNEPILYYINLKTKQTKVFPFNFEGTADLQSMHLDTASNILHVVLLNQYKLRSSKILIKAYRQDVEIQSTLLEGKDYRNLLDARYFFASADQQLVFGTYSKEYVKSPQGFFIADIDSTGAVRYMMYRGFDQLDNFFNYYEPKEEERIRDKISNLKKKDRELELPYEVILHPIVKKGDEYILFAEFLKAIYRKDFSGRTEINTFNGWAYNHAIAAAFNDNSKILWDNCFKISDNIEQVESRTLIPITNYRFRGDSLEMSYLYQDRIYQQTTLKDSILLEKKKEDLEKYQPEAGKLREVYRNQLIYWYDDYYLLWGYQRVGTILDKKQVFCVQKITLN